MKTTDTVGYARLVQALGLCVLTKPRPAITEAVKRVIASDTGQPVSHTVVTAPDSMLDHVLFALKYEGVNLTVLAQALPKIPAQDVLAELKLGPTGAYMWLPGSFPLVPSFCIHSWMGTVVCRAF